MLSDGVMDGLGVCYGVVVGVSHVVTVIEWGVNVENRVDDLFEFAAGSGFLSRFACRVDLSSHHGAVMSVHSGLDRLGVLV